MGFWKTLKWNAAAISIGSVVLGVILAGWPAIAARTVCYLLAAVLLLGAFSYLLSYLSGRRQSLPSGMDLAIGLVLVLAALLVAVKADQIIGLIPMVMGAVFAINGAVKLQRSVELKQVQYRGWGVVMFYAILTIGFGVLLLFNPFSARDDDGSDFGNRAFGQRRYGHYNHDECFPADSEGHAARSQLVQKGFFLKKRAVRRSFFNWNQKRMHARLSSPKMGFVERAVFLRSCKKCTGKTHHNNKGFPFLDRKSLSAK